MFKVGDKVEYREFRSDGVGVVTEATSTLMVVEGHPLGAANGPWPNDGTSWVHAHEVEPPHDAVCTIEPDHSIAMELVARGWVDGELSEPRVASGDMDALKLEADERRFMVGGDLYVERAMVESTHRKLPEWVETGAGFDPDGLPRTEDRPGWTPPAKHDPPPAPMQAGIDWDWVDWCVKDAKGDE